MTQDRKYLQELTDAVLKELRKLEIVTPELFNTIYKAKIKDLNFNNIISIENTNEALLKKYYKIQEDTKKNAQLLNENATKAKVAIENKDENLLSNVNQNMSMLLEKISKLQEQLYTDELTKVYNRKYLFEEILEDDKFKDNGVISFIDLDKFKYINDNFGHIVGDKVLVMIAKLLKELEDSKVIRYGGDEFIVISYLPFEKVESFFKTTTENLKRRFFKYNDEKFKIGFSYGLLEFNKDDIFSKIVEQVDHEMYKQKQSKKLEKEFN